MERHYFPLQGMKGLINPRSVIFVCLRNNKNNRCLSACVCVGERGRQATLNKQNSLSSPSEYLSVS